ncbi:hypothetical protein GCM10017778_31240 [Streptomyces vinaceus]|nr:hypothetical protein GCM10017778_31240 [Streptomyces vinaceus]
MTPATDDQRPPANVNTPRQTRTKNRRKCAEYGVPLGDTQQTHPAERPALSTASLRIAVLVQATQPGSVTASDLAGAVWLSQFQVTKGPSASGERDSTPRCCI